jgi:UDP-N-acetylglucosamine 4-epimerase
MTRFDDILGGVRGRWLVTGAAGFIGSNLVEWLLRGGQAVVGLDNFATGHQRNLDEVRRLVGESDWARFRFIRGDIRNADDCRAAVDGADYVLHQAALGSVPRSLAEPLASFDANVTGFVHILTAARDAGVKRFVYASSSSVYGDNPDLPKLEGRVGRPLSPYAATKCANELFADVWARSYGMSCLGLRYFNVFGPRQDPEGAYAAVIPRWAAAMLRGDTCQINGDGKTSRDFCFVANAVQANLRAALASTVTAPHEVLNIACGETTDLEQLFAALNQALADRAPQLAARLRSQVPSYQPFRAGDVRHSLAAISRAETLIGYRPTHRLAEGLAEAAEWYLQSVDRAA